MSNYKVGEIINVRIYDPDQGRTYLLGFYAMNDKDALEQANNKVTSWGHKVKGTACGQPYQRIEGSRVKQDSLWYY